ncbi:ABC transporter permease [Microbacterium sp.]|uniref:ABC transporter permease n=1 Tax=Microbacterium sp. TaxID=51671 RepID=UPI003A951013
MTVIAEAPEISVAAPPPASAPRPTQNAARRILLRLAVLGVTVVLWWLLADVVLAANPVVSKMGPVDTLRALAGLVGDPSFLDAITVSLWRLLAGLGIAVVIGVPLGVLFGSRRTVEDAVNPVVQFLRMTSPLAWAPLAIVLLGAGTGAVIALVALAAVWPIVLGVAAGVRALDPGLRKVARSLGATRWEAFRSTALPALTSPIVGSSRVALGISWVVLVPAEMLGVPNGLGYAILNARDNIDYSGLAATMFAIGVLGFLLDRILRGLHRLVDAREAQA